MFLGKFRSHLLGVDYVSLFFCLTLKGVEMGNKDCPSLGRGGEGEGGSFDVYERKGQERDSTLRGVGAVCGSFRPSGER